MFLLNCMTLSPSGRFAYYHTLKQIYQYDLEAQDIAGSKTLVATFDGFQSAGNSTDFYKSQLAPDGKIYINSFGPVYYLHVIEHPDSLGLACQVKQHSIELPNYHFAAMPNYPDYRLGALEGSPCDTILSATKEPLQENGLRLYPNPASTFVQLPFAPDHLQVFNMLGQRVSVSFSSEMLDVSALPPGIYQVLAEKNGLLYAGKLAVGR
jgi:hypothetical protein